MKIEGKLVFKKDFTEIECFFQDGEGNEYHHSYGHSFEEAEKEMYVSAWNDEDTISINMTNGKYILTMED